MTQPELQALCTKDCRLTILQALASVPGYLCNHRVLQAYLNHQGHSVSADKIRTELAWLDEQGLLHTKQFEQVCTAQLTERGLDVAGGNAKCPGVGFT